MSLSTSSFLQCMALSWCCVTELRFLPRPINKRWETALWSTRHQGPCIGLAIGVRCSAWGEGLSYRPGYSPGLLECDIKHTRVHWWKLFKLLAAVELVKKKRADSKELLHTNTKDCSIIKMDTDIGLWLLNPFNTAYIWIFTYAL